LLPHSIPPPLLPRTIMKHFFRNLLNWFVFFLKTRSPSIIKLNRQLIKTTEFFKVVFIFFFFTYSLAAFFFDLNCICHTFIYFNFSFPFPPRLFCVTHRLNLYFHFHVRTTLTKKNRWRHLYFFFPSSRVCPSSLISGGEGEKKHTYSTRQSRELTSRAPFP
jgi:hypothetical protein